MSNMWRILFDTDQEFNDFSYEDILLYLILSAEKNIDHFFILTKMWSNLYRFFYKKQ